ncbi:MAG: hypothetical protein KBD88_02090 [Aliarcobacter sp.]|nr:hypothetical protein [Aliarcobacter sp.]
MKQIITLLILIFVFFGCTQKQTVPLKLPQNKEKVTELKIKKEKAIAEAAPVIEGLKPIDIKVSEGTLPDSSTAVIEDSIPDGEIISEIQVDLAKVKIKVAFIYPSSLVEKYAKTSLSTISGYLSYQKADYDLTIIDSTNENYENINSAFAKAKQNGVTKIIGLFTPSAISSLDKIVTSDIKVYLPLIEKSDALTNNENLIFGSISYDQQVKKLISYSNTNNAMFYQNTYIGNKLKKAYDASVYDTRVRKEISKTETNFKYIVNDYKLNNSTLFLNTDLVKTSLILSQLRAYDISPKAILSTQVSYDPMLMLLTQDQDRDKLVIANSIDSVNNELRDEISTFGGNIVYEWVDYSTLVGINYLYYGNNSNLVQTKIIENQAVYNPKLYKSTEVGFLEIK